MMLTASSSNAFFRMMRGSATVSPSLSAKKLRPFETFSPLRVLDSTPKNCDVTYGSRTTVVRLLGGEHRALRVLVVVEEGAHVEVDAVVAVAGDEVLPHAGIPDGGMCLVAALCVW